MGDVGKVDVRGQVGQADIEEGVVDGVVAVVADQCAHMPLRMVVLGSVEAVVNHDDGTALQFVGQGAYKGILCRMKFAGVRFGIGKIAMCGIYEGRVAQGVRNEGKLSIFYPDADLQESAFAASNQFAWYGIQYFVADNDAVERVGKGGQMADFVCCFRGGLFDVCELPFRQFGGKFDDAIRFQIVV